jgi:hypothetical protein
MDVSLIFTGNKYLMSNTNIICFYGAGSNDFEAGNIHYKGHCKGWALKIETFWALIWQLAI